MYRIPFSPSQNGSILTNGIIPKEEDLFSAVSQFTFPLSSLARHGPLNLPSSFARQSKTPFSEKTITFQLKKQWRHRSQKRGNLKGIFNPTKQFSTVRKYNFSVDELSHSNIKQTVIFPRPYTELKKCWWGKGKRCQTSLSFLLHLFLQHPGAKKAKRFLCEGCQDVSSYSSFALTVKCLCLRKGKGENWRGEKGKIEGRAPKWNSTKFPKTAAHLLSFVASGIA